MSSALAVLAALLAGGGGDRPQWGERHGRNMVSDETGLPDRVEAGDGATVLWTAPLGSETYGSPVVAGGRVYLGTNNARPRDPRAAEDRGVLLCLDAADGRLRWQLSVPKRGPSPYWDWPRSGFASPATADGDLVFAVTNRGEVVALDPAGMADGNAGPVVDEAAIFSLPESGPADADVVWRTDLVKETGIRQHDGAHASILVDGPFLYLNTSNGLDDRHSAVERPDAPALVVLDRASGRVLAREREGISRGTFHCSWSSPSLGVVDGRRLVFFGGGDGVLYAFEALRAAPAGELPATLRPAWKADCDPEAPKTDRQSYIRNRREGPSVIKGMPVFVDGRVYVTFGGDVWWGKRKAWISCFDASGSGDVTRGGLAWRTPLLRHCMSTPAVRDGLVYVADHGNRLWCLDAKDGAEVWSHDVEAEVWASPLAADGKVYLGTRGGVFWVLAAGRERRVISRTVLDGPVNATATAANGVLFVATMKTLTALSTGR